MPQLLRPGMKHVEVIHLDRHVRHRRAGSAFGCDAYLHGRLIPCGQRCDPALIHHYGEFKEIGIELTYFGDRGGGDIGDDAFDGHGAEFFKLARDKQLFGTIDQLGMFW